jgi:hypothetical protein
MASQVDEVVLSHDIDGKPTDFCANCCVNLCHGRTPAPSLTPWVKGSKHVKTIWRSAKLTSDRLISDWYQVDIRLDLLDLLNLRYLRLQWQVPTGNTGTMRSSPTVPRGAAKQKTARKGSDTSRWWGTQKDSRNKRPKQNEKTTKNPRLEKEIKRFLKQEEIRGVGCTMLICCT